MLPEEDKKQVIGWVGLGGPDADSSSEWSFVCDFEEQDEKKSSEPPCQHERLDEKSSEPPCQHERLTRRGSNHFKTQMKCIDCGVIVKQELTEAGLESQYKKEYKGKLCTK